MKNNGIKTIIRGDTEQLDKLTEIAEKWQQEYDKRLKMYNLAKENKNYEQIRR